MRAIGCAHATAGGHRMAGCEFLTSSSQPPHEVIFYVIFLSPTACYLLWFGDEVARLLVAEVDRIAKHMDVEQLPHIFALVIA